MYADMICDVMPAIPEDSAGMGMSQEGTGESDHSEDAQANIEQLMVSMLEERDKVIWLYLFSSKKKIFEIRL